MDNETTQDKNTLEGLPIAMVRKRRFSMMWLIPLISLGFVGYFLWANVIQEKGEIIEIRFESASGVREGTSLRYRGVQVGMVRSIELDSDLEGAIVHAELIPSATSLAREGTQFWVVQAEVSLKGIAGLETLLGPNYIALRPGETQEQGDSVGVLGMKSSFVGLDGTPIGDRPNDESLRLTLRSDRLGTLSAGSAVLYREIRVGTVRDAKLISDSTAVEISIDIDPKYAPLVHENTRFWRSGGVGFNLGIFSGLSVQADSLESAISSSISLATPEKKMGELAQDGDVFDLEDVGNVDWLKWAPEIELGG